MPKPDRKMDADCRDPAITDHAFLTATHFLLIIKQMCTAHATLSINGSGLDKGGGGGWGTFIHTFITAFESRRLASESSNMRRVSASACKDKDAVVSPRTSAWVKWERPGLPQSWAWHTTSSATVFVCRSQPPQGCCRIQVRFLHGTLAASRGAEAAKWPTGQ